MAIRAIMLRKWIDNKKADLEKLREAQKDIETREAELETAIQEAQTEEEQKAVEESVDALIQEKEQAAKDADGIEKAIEQMEKELETEERAQNTEHGGAPAPADNEERSKKPMNNNETRAAVGYTMRDRLEAIVTRDDVKSYLGEIRAAMKEKRAITNVGLTIPEVMLDLLRENIEGYSKLYKHVNVKPINGTGRQLIMGTVPEAIWTDCCANLNELTLGFNDLELDCFRVGGYYALCVANQEDSDLNLAAEIMTALGQAIGLALDKAILYGRNSSSALKMPMGIVTRLVQTSQPDGYPATARTWQDLHTSNVKTIASGTSGANLISAIVLNAGAAKGKYSKGQKTWCMSEATYTKLMAATVSVDAAGRIVTGVANTMPVVGGVIETLDFIPDNVIIGGYFDLYTLAERAGQKFASSEHVRFLQDQVVYKGTARYDGAPAIAEGFVAMDINGGTVAATDVTFAPDDANSVQSIMLNTATASVAVSGTKQLFAITSPGTGTVTWSSATTSKATVDDNGVVTGVSTGSSVITATANGMTASCTVTVTGS